MNYILFNNLIYYIRLIQPNSLHCVAVCCSVLQCITQHKVFTILCVPNYTHECTLILFNFDAISFLFDFWKSQNVC